MGIVKNRKIWYAISGLFVAASIFSIFYFGLRLGIDFTGGS
ncbi:protein translocase subunit SecF, partial [Patescibacteria group bacterium]|nr:protein translocase subunit SecF [Patescibacteria group bacterium]